MKTIFNEEGMNEGILKILFLPFLLSSFVISASAVTRVEFPINTMFGGAAYGKRITITATETLFTDGANLWAGTYINVPGTGTNPIVSLHPAAYLLTIQDVVKAARFRVPDSTNILNIVDLISSGATFYFGTNGFETLIPGSNITFTTNSDGSITVASSGGGTITAASLSSGTNTFAGAGTGLTNISLKVGRAMYLGDGIAQTQFPIWYDKLDTSSPVFSYNPNSGDFLFAYGVTVTNTVTAGSFVGDGSALTGVIKSGGTVSNLTLQTANIGTFGNITANEPMLPRWGIFTYYCAYNGTNWYAGAPDATSLAALGISDTSGGVIACDISEFLSLMIMTNMVNDGMVARGHRWFNLDDGWQGTRAANGIMEMNTSKFPHGGKWLVDKAHSMGILISIFTADAGLTNCGKDGSGGTNAANDAVTYRNWGVDYVVACDIVDSISDVQRRYNSDHLQTALRNANFHGGYQVSISRYTNGTSGYQSWMLSSANSVLLSDSDDSDWNKCMATFDIAAAASGQLKQGHYPTLLPYQSGSFITSVAGNNGYNLGRLRVSSSVMVNADNIFDRSLVAYAGIAATLQAQNATNFADFETNRFVDFIGNNRDFQAPVKAFTNGTVEAWTKRLRGSATLGIPDGAFAVMVINRGWATNVSGTSITVPITAFGATTNGSATATFLDCWNYSNQVVTAASKVFDAPTNSCSLWIVSLAPPGYTGTFTGNGAGLTNIPNSSLTNVPFLNAVNTFTGPSNNFLTGTNYFSSVVVTGTMTVNSTGPSILTQNLYTTNNGSGTSGVLKTNGDLALSGNASVGGTLSGTAGSLTINMGSGTATAGVNTFSPSGFLTTAGQLNPSGFLGFWGSGFTNAAGNPPIDGTSLNAANVTGSFPATTQNAVLTNDARKIKLSGSNELSGPLLLSYAVNNTAAWMLGLDSNNKVVTNAVPSGGGGGTATNFVDGMIPGTDMQWVGGTNSFTLTGAAHNLLVTAGLAKYANVTNRLGRHLVGITVSTINDAATDFRLTLVTNGATSDGTVYLSSATVGSGVWSGSVYLPPGVVYHLESTNGVDRQMYCTFETVWTVP